MKSKIGDNFVFVKLLCCNYIRLTSKLYKVKILQKI